MTITPLALICSNPVILRLQMRFMLCAMDVYHCPGSLMQPDFLSRLGTNLCFDELSRKYLNNAIHLRKLYPPVTGTMMPESTPDYRGSTVWSAFPVDSCIPAAFGAPSPSDFAEDSSIAPFLTFINMGLSGGHHFSLQTFPISMGCLDPSEQEHCRHEPLYNCATSVLVDEILNHCFAVYGFNSGHFAFTSSQTPQALDIVFAADSR